MSRRIYSDKYIDERIAKIDEMNERNRIVVNLPRCMGSALEESDVRAYIKQVRELSYVQGFWAGWTLRDGQKD